MDWVTSGRKLNALLRQYWYVLLVLGVGLILMLIPSTDADTEAVIPQETESILTVEEQLEAILSQVAGAGEVRVMLSLSSGEETLYQTNHETAVSENSTDTQSDTVTVTDADRNEIGLIRQINPARYLGAIVVCKGADSPSVRLAIIEAVSKVTGLGADKISVLKMK